MHEKSSNFLGFRASIEEEDALIDGEKRARIYVLVQAAHAGGILGTP